MGSFGQTVTGAMVIAQTESTELSDPDLTINCVSGLIDNGRIPTRFRFDRQFDSGVVGDRFAVEIEAPIETPPVNSTTACVILISQLHGM